MQMTFDEYDKAIERFDQINSKTFWPTIEQIDSFRQNPDKWILFCCYLYEKGTEPETKEEKYSKKNLSMFINENLVLVDDEAEV